MTKTGGRSNNNTSGFNRKKKEGGTTMMTQAPGLYEMSYKVGKTHFMVVLSEEGRDQVRKIHTQFKDDKNMMSLELSENILHDLAIDEIYVGHVGDHASRQQLEVAFGTVDKREIVKQILIHGKFH
jgi:hypothetical protein